MNIDRDKREALAKEFYLNTIKKYMASAELDFNYIATESFDAADAFYRISFNYRNAEEEQELQNWIESNITQTEKSSNKLQIGDVVKYIGNDGIGDHLVASYIGTVGTIAAFVQGSIHYWAKVEVDKSERNPNNYSKEFNYIDFPAVDLQLVK